jgi:hypothetical protein
METPVPPILGKEKSLKDASFTGWGTGFIFWEAMFLQLAFALLERMEDTRE